jgi:sugar/nucleoside kinase (ribokinase family)
MTVRGNGRRTFFYHPGASAFFREEDVEFSGGEKIFYLGYLLLLDRLDEIDGAGTTGAGRLLKRAREVGCLTAVDLVSGAPERFPEIIPPTLPQIDVLFLNEYEASCLLQQEIEDSAAGFERAARAVLALGVRRVVVLHSPRGAVAVGGEGPASIQPSVALPAEKIRGAVGAGDAFAAGFLFGLHEEQGIEQCLLAGVCAAAACLTEETTSGGIASLQEALAMGERYGMRTSF